MTIGKGTAYGELRPLPADGVVASTDAEARAVVEQARREHRPVPPLGLLGGDLCRTLGGLGDEPRLRSPEATTFAVDLGCVRLDGRECWFVAHLAAHRRGWRGRSVVVMNAEWLGEWDLGPRSHPGDGILDVTDGSLGLRERLQARRRARTGTHLPHPDLRTRRAAELTLSFASAVPVFLDGDAVGSARELVVSVEPDALSVTV